LPLESRSLGEEFLKGINIHSPESRDYCLETIEFLRKTPIEWLRIHPLPSRRLKARGPSGISHLDSIEKYAEAGFNLIIPIDVGVKENVGLINAGNLRSFVDDSYGESYRAVKQIEARIGKYGRRVIYGVENEIDTKEWIMQSMPNVAWRGEPLAWIRLSVDKEMKFRRLGHILEGIREAASPDSLTMVNFEADDPHEDWNTQMSILIAAQTVFSKLGVLEKGARHRMNNYRLDVQEAMRRLRSFDIIGLDNYPNYFTKIPPKGKKVGIKVDEIARLTRKPVINVEFGYTRHGRGTKPLKLLSPPSSLGENVNGHPLSSPEDLQKEFFQNALGSIENSSSQGTFPWVFFLDPAHGYKPTEENGFSLLNLGANMRFEPAPALDLYITWLDNMKNAELQKEADEEKQIGASERRPSASQVERN
jgi:hypothetical protein